MARQSKPNAAQKRVLDAIALARADFILAFKALFDPYRPERHYMRGPGPKWHAKRSAACADCS